MKHCGTTMEIPTVKTSPAGKVTVYRCPRCGAVKTSTAKPPKPKASN